MATPCNNITECFDGSDENECNFPEWVLYSISVLAALILNITSFFSLQNHVKKAAREILQDKRWRLATENENSQEILIASEKLMKVAFYAEKGNIDEIKKLLRIEIRAHGNVARAMCCLKVNEFLQKITFLISYKNKLTPQTR